MLAYLLHGVTLMLAWFLTVNAIASGIVAVVIGRLATDAASRSPRFWFVARMLPAVIAAAFVTLLFVPSYVKYEPRQDVEGFDLTLTALAIAALVLCISAGVRGLVAWRAAAGRTAAWMRTARPRAFGGVRMLAFEIEAGAPVMALAGILHPRLLVTRGLIDVLTDEEFSASVAHEVGHSRAWDNLKRLAMRSTPDLLGATTAARVIERRWAAAAERSADQHAAAAGATARCALASALVKVARLMPPGPVAEPLSTLVSDGDVAARVEGLLDDRPRVEPSRRLLRAAAIGLVIAGLAAYAPLLRIVHSATEILVSSLP